MEGIRCAAHSGWSVLRATCSVHSVLLKLKHLSTGNVGGGGYFSTYLRICFLLGQLEEQLQHSVRLIFLFEV